MTCGWAFEVFPESIGVSLPELFSNHANAIVLKGTPQGGAMRSSSTLPYSRRSPLKKVLPRRERRSPSARREAPERLASLFLLLLQSKQKKTPRLGLEMDHEIVRRRRSNFFFFLTTKAPKLRLNRE